jgi:hypothetical protein
MSQIFDNLSQSGLFYSSKAKIKDYLTLSLQKDCGQIDVQMTV